MSHYIAKASKARKSGFAVLGTEAFIGELPPKEGRLLYMGCVDSHLTSGADIIIDVDDGALAHLEKVQTAFLRRLLGLGPYSIRAPLFTELGLVPIRYRRLILAIRYLGYLISLVASHYARAALEDSFLLFCTGQQGYWMDLHCALRKLPFPVTLPPLTALTLESCTALGKAVYTSAMKFLDSKVENSARLYLLHNRREPLEDEAPRKITVVLRHYLNLVVNAKHRKALTRLLAPLVSSTPSNSFEDMLISSYNNLLAASWINCMLFMLELVLAVRYFQHSSRPWLHRAGIAAMAASDLLCTFTICAKIYQLVSLHPSGPPQGFPDFTLQTSAGDYTLDVHHVIISEAIPLAFSYASAILIVVTGSPFGWAMLASR
ncbi:hypothetical protein B0H14DRAFT_3453273 [Mycena olivaceomarginata]|nr:hypothetical protein B0H14DRAFT_3453273 [Mycena olivaceomarginata]